MLFQVHISAVVVSVVISTSTFIVTVLLCLLQMLSTELKRNTATATSTTASTCPAVRPIYRTLCDSTPCGKFKRYISDPWNVFDQLMHIVLLVAVILRFTLTDDNDFMWARYVYAINVIMFYLRILHLFYIHPRLGPEVIVIYRMVGYMSLLSRKEDHTLTW